MYYYILLIYYYILLCITIYYYILLYITNILLYITNIVLYITIYYYMIKLLLTIDHHSSLSPRPQRRLHGAALGAQRRRGGGGKHRHVQQLPLGGATPPQGMPWDARGRAGVEGFYQKYGYVQHMAIIEGSLEVKLPTIWTDEKRSRAEAERRGRLEERRSEEKESGRKKMQMREKVGKSRNTVFFQWFVAPEGRKVGSLKRRVRSQLARWAMKNCTPLWREAHFEVKMCKTHQVRTTFGSWDVETVHAVLARSTFPSQKC